MLNYGIGHKSGAPAEELFPRLTYNRFYLPLFRDLLNSIGKGVSIYQTQLLYRLFHFCSLDARNKQGEQAV